MWSALGLSSLGDGMVVVAIPLLTVSLTSDPVRVAGATVAGTLPGLLFALPAGVLADRYNRRTLAWAVDFASFVLLGIFTMLLVGGRVSLSVLYATAFLAGAFAVTSECVAEASLPSLVQPDHLLKGNSRLYMVDVTGDSLLGTALGGVLFTVARWIPFLIDAVSFLASAALLRSAIPDTKPEPSDTKIVEDLAQGWRWFKNHGLIRVVTALIFTFAFCQTLVFALLVLYGTRDLHLSNAAYGLLLGLTALGNVVGAGIAPDVHHRIGPGWSLLAAGTVAAISYPVLALTTSPYLACLALAVEAIAVSVGSVGARSLRQQLVPSEMQGRVGSVFMTFKLAAFPLGALVGGILGSTVGVRVTFALAGLIQLIVVGMLSPRLLRQVRIYWRPGSRRRDTIVNLTDRAPAGSDLGDLELVPEPADGGDAGRPGRVLLDLRAEPLDVDVEGLGVPHVVGSPDPVDQGLAGEDPPGVGEEELQQLELLEG